MTTYTKPSVRNAWGQTATGADLQDPGNTYASAGWQIGVKPPRQYFNWVLNYVFGGIRYLCQQGITEWDVAETYRQNAYVTVSGYLYCSLINNNIGNNPATTFGSAWSAAATITPIRSVGTWQITNISYVEANFLPVGSAFTAINGQIQNTQVPVGAVTQWQGSLSIGGGQVTSAVSQANSWFLSGVGYVQPVWSGNSGQPTWLFGSNNGSSIQVWNPANFNVANANTVAGLSVTSAASGNTVMARDGGGYAYAQYFNQASPNNENPSISQFAVTNGSDGFLRKAGVSAVASALGTVSATPNTLMYRDGGGYAHAVYFEQESPNNENPSISQFMVTNGSDGYLRKAGISAVQSAIGALTNANFSFSSAGYQRISSGAIIQGGRVSVNGPTTVVFPLAFPNGCFSVVLTGEGTFNEVALTSPPTRTSFQANSSAAETNWIAFGW